MDGVLQMTAGDQIRTLQIGAWTVTVDDQLGKLCVEHSGIINFEMLQLIKDAVWGEDARAIEVYPRAADIVNNGLFRHLWRLGEGDFCPDLLGHSPSTSAVSDALEYRSAMAWREADTALPGQARVWEQSGSEFK